MRSTPCRTGATTRRPVSPGASCGAAKRRTSPRGAAAMARNEAAVAFGREVRHRRHAQGLTLDALGEAAGLTPHYVGRIEAGQRDPSISSMTKIAAGLGAPLA